MKFAIVLALGSLALASACAPLDQPSAGFGNAVHHNINAQVVNPDANAGDLPPPELVGERTRDAFDRYREGNVKRPIPLGTTNGVKK